MKRFELIYNGVSSIFNASESYRGEQVSQFQHGAPSGHLRNYRRI